jgi:NADH-quinone oxidoreductase subunit M
MWPVHTWLPDAHVQAPTGGSVILAAVMLKLGTYAYMRFSMGLFPGPASTLSANLAGVAILGGILYGALVAWKQRDIKRLVAYSSVAHLGYVMLGLFGATPSGMQGAVLQMVNHGVSTGALFMLVGVDLRPPPHPRGGEFGGLAKVMPIYATVFLIVTFSSIGVPGTNGFIGEFLVITGHVHVGAARELQRHPHGGRGGGRHPRRGLHAGRRAEGVLRPALEPEEQAPARPHGPRVARARARWSS